MKIFLLVIVVICCFLIAFKIKEYFIKRKKFFESLLTFCQNIKSKISYQNEKLALMIDEELKIQNNKSFCEFLSLFKNLLNQTISLEAFEKEFNSTLSFLKQEERTYILNFFKSLGGYFQEEEIEKISNFEKWAKTQFDNILNFNKKFANLYFKLFIILGVMLFIIFI